jgi:hypothetical protein
MTSKKELAKAMFAKPEDVTDHYRMTADDLRIMMHQTLCTEDQANEYFNKNRGDLENAIIDYLESTEVLQKEKCDVLVSDQDLLKDEISTYDKMSKYRDILNRKDAIFQEKFDESSNFDDYQIVTLEYIPFNNTTNNYRKMKFKGTKEFFSLEILRPYLEGTLNDNQVWEMSKTNRDKDDQKEKIKLYHNVEMTVVHETEEEVSETKVESELKTDVKAEPDVKAESDVKVEPDDKVDVKVDDKVDDEVKEKLKMPSNHKIVLKKLAGQGATMAKKWTCYNSVIAFLDQESEQVKENEVNKLATKFMRNSGYLGEKENIRGPAIVIDNWFL